MAHRASSSSRQSEDKLAFLSNTMRGISLSRDPYPVELMDANRVRQILNTGGDLQGGGAKGKTPAKITSFHIDRLSDKVIGKIDRLRPLEDFWKTLWATHIQVCEEPLPMLVDEIPGVSNSTGFPCIKKELRNDIKIYLPMIERVYAQIVMILDTFAQNQFEYTEEQVGSGEVSYVYKAPDSGLPQDQISMLEFHKDTCTRMLKIAIAINIATLEEMDVPKSIWLQKDDKAILGKNLYRFLKDSIDEVKNDGSLEDIEPRLNIDAFLPSKTKLEAYEIAIKLEKVLHFWKCKMGASPEKSLEYMSLIINARYLLQEIRIKFRDIAPTSFSAEKIRNNEDVGRAFLESYSKAMEKLILKVVTLIVDVLDPEC